MAGSSVPSTISAIAELSPMASFRVKHFIEEFSDYLDSWRSTSLSIDRDNRVIYDT